MPIDIKKIVKKVFEQEEGITVADYNTGANIIENDLQAENQNII